MKIRMLIVFMTVLALVGGITVQAQEANDCRINYKWTAPGFHGNEICEDITTDPITPAELPLINYELSIKAEAAVNFNIVPLPDPKQMSVFITNAPCGNVDSKLCTYFDNGTPSCCKELTKASYPNQPGGCSTFE